MATHTHITRRSILAGRGAAIAAAGIAGTALAAPPISLLQQAEDLIWEAREVRIGLYTYPGHSGLWVMEPVDEPQTDEEMEVWHRLKKQLRDQPALRAEVLRVLSDPA
jgi:hypothetical protein